MKKILAILLCLVMVLGCLVGCAKTETKQEEKKEETKQEEKKEEPKKEEKKEDKKEDPQPAEDPNALPAPGTLPFANGDVVTVGLPANLNVIDYETNEWTKWIEENTGVDLQFVLFSNDSTEAQTQLALMIASGEKLPDILYKFDLPTTKMNEYGEEGYLVDLMPFYETDAYFIAQNLASDGFLSQDRRDNYFNFGKDPANGALYGLCTCSMPSETSADTAQVKVAVNQTWLDAVGMEVPTNVDELYDVLVAFRDKDPNGNGKQDEIPLIGKVNDDYRSDIIQYIINAFEYCDDRYLFAVEDGHIYLPYITDEYRQAMIYLNKLYNEGLLSPLSLSITTDAEMQAVWTPADGTAICGVVGGHPTLHVDKNSEIIREYIGVGPLTGATSHGGYGPTSPGSNSYNTYITTDCENPALAFRVLDFMMERETQTRGRNGVRGVTWDYATGDEVNSLGTPALYIKGTSWGLPEADHWSEQSNDTWHANIYMPVAKGERSGDAVKGYSDPPTLANCRTMINRAQTKLFLACPKPEETVSFLVYSAEENEIVSAVQTHVEDCVQEARVFFITGVLDPNDDAAWNQYLSDMKGEGADLLVKQADSAFQRMKS